MGFQAAHNDRYDPKRDAAGACAADRQLKPHCRMCDYVNIRIYENSDIRIDTCSIMRLCEYANSRIDE